jgi:3-hydroxybutyryl-CoA dehydratase
VSRRASFQEGDLLPTVERLVDQPRIELYAEASGDFNPIHVDREYAAGTRFGSTIAHGMMVAATVSETMALAFDRRWADGGRLKLRFKAPVYPGDTVTAFGQVKRVTDVDGVREVVCSVGVRRQTGELAIVGEATVRLAQ